VDFSLTTDSLMLGSLPMHAKLLVIGTIEEGKDTNVRSNENIVISLPRA